MTRNKKEIYSPEFFLAIDEKSRESARAIIPVLQRLIPFRSALDLGSGSGAWIQELNRLGVSETKGVDISRYANPLEMQNERLEFFDIRKKLELNRKYDIVFCLEVAEHLEKIYADVLIENLIRHSDIIVFSAAQPGQGGLNHINEQPLFYWIEKFNKYNYGAFDIIRPLIAKNIAIAPWYRYNTILFCNRELSSTNNIPSLHQETNPRIISERNFEDTFWKLRKILVRTIPLSLHPSLFYIYNKAALHTKLLFNRASKYTQ